ncbi:MAG TPA: hypothetical protein ENI23_16355 [bacterium]|nr:hypothetical protein [bacterium]
MPHDYNYKKLPEHIRDSVQRYIEQGAPPGDFLTAVIRNDLKESFGRADDINIARMFDIVDFFYNEAPLECWGSPEEMEKWIKDGGVDGIIQARRSLSRKNLPQKKPA